MGKLHFKREYDIDTKARPAYVLWQIGLGDVVSTSLGSAATRMSSAAILADYDKRWAQSLGSERCPPILGLAPLSNDESDLLSRLVEEHLKELRWRGSESRFGLLIDLLRFWPAVTSVWLARKAGEAYDSGKFWDLFETQIGVPIQVSQRSEFAEWFQRSCSLVMSNYVRPSSLVAFKYVEAFLFQAGLPLCHCERFADCLRDVERRYGLADPRDADAGEEVRETLLLSSSFRVAPPMLRRAVQGPAGALICRAALEVLCDVKATEINPGLRQALERAFANVSPSNIQRSARPPHLRLSEDLSCLEIVGPKQESALIGQSGLSWVVNGERYPTAAWDEFVYTVRDESTVTVDLIGLRQRQSLSRTFSLSPNDMAQPFLVFDFVTRRSLKYEPGATVHLKSSSYWLFHPAAYRLEPSSHRFEWLNGATAVSLLELQPSLEVRLVGASRWTFKGNESPYCEIPSESLVTDDGVQIHYNWHEPIEVWLPVEGGDETDTEGWSLEIQGTAKWPLTGQARLGHVTTCRVDVSRFLSQLVPGLHFLQITVSYRGRRPEFVSRFWYWAGLVNYTEGISFRVSAPPRNLLPDQCQGFEISCNLITHKQFYSPRHILTFDIGGDANQFRWTQTGVFLESFEKRAGHVSPLQERTLGETFSASIDSHTYLRLWHVPCSPFNVIVNQQVVQSLPPLKARPWMDVSLAHLSTLFPNGGEIVLKSHAHETMVAKFTRPLVPTRVEAGASLENNWIQFAFPEDVQYVRPRVCDIASAQFIDIAGQELNSAGGSIFKVAGFPPIECARRGMESAARDHSGDRPRDVVADHKQIELRVPTTGWPPGLWFIELEVRQSESDEWQIIKTSSGARIPHLVAVMGSGADDIRSRIVLAGCHAERSHSLTGMHIQKLNPPLAECDDLLADIAQLVANGFAPQVRSKFIWLEQLFHTLGRFIGKKIAFGDKFDTAKLLNLACIATSHETETSSPLKRSLFVTVPELLALPADHYVGVSAGHPIGQALRWCYEISVHDLVFEAFRHLLEAAYENPRAAPSCVEVLRNFRNFSRIVATDPRVLTEDFGWFDYAQYFYETIGDLSSLQPQTDWDPRSALSRRHVEWALGRLRDRRWTTLGDKGLGSVNALLHTAPKFRTWLRNILDDLPIMPPSVWKMPWLSVSFDDDLMENCCHFASVFALSARAAGFGWLSFQDVIDWLTEQNTETGTEDSALAALVGMAPELFGYYLMFWELMIRSHPHV